MIAYNVRIKDFLDGQQVTMYSNSILKNVGKKEKKQKEDNTDYEPIIEPFTDTIVKNVNEFEIEKLKHEKSVSNSIKRTKNQIVDYARSNVWEWFLTITIKDEVIRNDYDLCSKKLSKWLNHMQTACDGKMKYIVVPEQHKLGGYHFHALVSNCENSIDFIDSGRYAIKRFYRGKQRQLFVKTDKYGGKKVYNCGNYKGGFTTATRVEDSERASNYICKYITKDLVQAAANKKRYWVSRNLDKPMVTLINDELSDLTMRRTDIQGSEQLYKRLYYTVCDKTRYVEYYEVDKQFFDTGLDGQIQTMGEKNDEKTD